MNPLETYLTELREIHDSGAATKETSGYPALAKLLDTVGHTLKPRVRCLIQLKNSGAGLPDAGLFTTHQIKQHHEQAPLFGLAPARGVFEVKSTSDELADIIPTDQIGEYLSLYGQLLLTNYRAFVLLKRSSSRFGYFVARVGCCASRDGWQGDVGGQAGEGLGTCRRVRKLAGGGWLEG